MHDPRRSQRLIYGSGSRYVSKQRLEAYLFWAGSVESPRSAAGRFSKLLQRVWLKAGIKDGHAHRLRDTAAVEWLKAGVPLEEVSRLLGHKSIKTTEKYYAPWVQARQRRLDSILRDATAKILENEEAALQGNHP